MRYPVYLLLPAAASGSAIVFGCLSSSLPLPLSLKCTACRGNLCNTIQGISTNLYVCYSSRPFDLLTVVMNVFFTMLQIDGPGRSGRVQPVFPLNRGDFQRSDVGMIQENVLDVLCFSRSGHIYESICCALKRDCGSLPRHIIYRKEETTPNGFAELAPRAFVRYSHACFGLTRWGLSRLFGGSCHRYVLLL